MTLVLVCSVPRPDGCLGETLLIRRAVLPLVRLRTMMTLTEEAEQQEARRDLRKAAASSHNAEASLHEIGHSRHGFWMMARMRGGAGLMPEPVESARARCAALSTSSTAVLFTESWLCEADAALIAHAPYDRNRTAFSAHCFPELNWSGIPTVVGTFNCPPVCEIFRMTQSMTIEPLA